MDRAIYATWYDLPDDLSDGDRAAYLAWLHEAHLPAVRARPGHVWAAHYESAGGGVDMQAIREIFPARDPDLEIGTGTQFVALIGAAEPWSMLAPSIAALEAAAVGRDREMLDLRRGVRTCLFAEVARVNGPAIADRPFGTTPGPVIQMGSFRTREIADEFDAGAWYAQYRLPAMARMPGCIAARVMLSLAGWAKFAVLYEFTSYEARMEQFEKPHEALARDPDEWSGRLVRYTVHAPGSPTVGRRLWPPVG